MFRWETSDVTIVRSAWRHSAECVRGLCGVRGDMVRSLCAGRAEPFGGSVLGGGVDTRSVTSVTGVTGKCVVWESEGSVRDFYYYI